MPFDLSSTWALPAPVETVWARLRDVEGWPHWWPCAEDVALIEPGDADGLGARHCVRWATALPYRLDIDTIVVAIDPLRRIEIEASGELDGRGTWTFAPGRGGCIARYRWQVRLRKGWMRRAAPLLRPVFAWNHGKVMGRGEAGLRRLLGNASG